MPLNPVPKRSQEGEGSPAPEPWGTPAALPLVKRCQQGLEVICRVLLGSSASLSSGDWFLSPKVDRAVVLASSHCSVPCLSAIVEATRLIAPGKPCSWLSNLQLWDKLPPPYMLFNQIRCPDSSPVNHQEASIYTRRAGDMYAVPSSCPSGGKTGFQCECNTNFASSFHWIAELYYWEHYTSIFLEGCVSLPHTSDFLTNEELIQTICSFWKTDISSVIKDLVLPLPCSKDETASFED